MKLPEALSDLRVQIGLQVLLMLCNGYINLLNVLGDDPQYRMLALFLMPALQAFAAACALYINPNGSPAYTESKGFPHEKRSITFTRKGSPESESGHDVDSDGSV